MIIEFTENGWEDFAYWIEHDQTMVDKIKEPVLSIRREPFRGPGKPEPLKYGLKGFWSGRTTQDHRLVCRISGKKGTDQRCSIIQCRFHYSQ